MFIALKLDMRTFKFYQDINLSFVLYLQENIELQKWIKTIS